MHFDKDHKIEKVVGSDCTRAPLLNVRLDCERKVLVATDGTCLAVVPCTVDPGDTTGAVTPEVLKAARSEAKGVKKEPNVTAGENFVLPSGVTMPRPAGDGYPDWAAVLARCKPNADTATLVAIDVSLLVRVAQALGTERVVLTVPPANGPVIVQPADEVGSENLMGVVMPLRRDAVTCKGIAPISSDATNLKEQ